MEELGKLIVAKGFKKLPKVKKSPNLVTLILTTFAAKYDLWVKQKNYSHKKLLTWPCTFMIGGAISLMCLSYLVNWIQLIFTRISDLC